MTPKPFLIIPWDTDFLSCFKDVILEATDNYPGKATVVFMHDRPRRYLTHLFKTDPAVPRPCLLPRMLTVGELFSSIRTEQDCLRNEKSHAPRRKVGLADQVALLSACVHELATSEPEICRHLAATDEAAFFPWGVRLATLMEECFTQALEPDDLTYTENEVAPFGAALLGALGRIFRLYRNRLETDALLTPGFEAYLAASRLSDEALPACLRNKEILIAGCNTLTGTEEKLFRFLWQKGARFCLHLDPAVQRRKEGAAAHWSCVDQVRWIEAWGARTELHSEPSGSAPQLRFFAGYDLHSQLHALQEDMTARPLREAEESMAVVLTHAGALLPVLHHLPDKGCNISLGYPLERSLLFRLIETILEARDQNQPDGRVRWKPLVELVRHPYLRMLRSGDIRLREILRQAERLLRLGPRFVLLRSVAREAIGAIFSGNPEERIEELPGPKAIEAVKKLLDRVLLCTVEDWSKAETLEQTAEALSALCTALLEYGEDIWRRFPLDAECLFRLRQQIIPALRNNALAQTVLPWPVRKALLLELIRAERVPFEADPITGLQVLGMLETRLLRFDRVAVIDVTDDHLPGAPSRNPLLPDSLRKVLGLPDAGRRELLAAYTFHRLLACAREVSLYWQEGVECAGLFDGKKQRSRLVEELIWREEKKRGRLLHTGEPPLRTASLRVRPPERRRKPVVRSGAAAAYMRDLLASPCSASLLDAYLACPLRFYYQRVCRFNMPEALTEEDDPAAVGELVHTVLRKFYEPWTGRTVRRSDLSETALRGLFEAELQASALPSLLPPESAVMLSVAGPERLVRFLRHQPEHTEILHLETRFETELTVRGRKRHLTGFLDRVDNRDGEAVILDYKTGRLKSWRTSTLTDENMWTALADAVCEGADSARIIDPEQDLLPELAEKVPSLQLPCYLYLYAYATGRNVRDAAYVALGEDGEEHPLLGDLPEDLRETLTQECFPGLMRFVLLHMEYCPEFRPREGRHCDWCLFRSLCML